MWRQWPQGYAVEDKYQKLDNFRLTSLSSISLITFPKRLCINLALFKSK